MAASSLTPIFSAEIIAAATGQWTRDDGSVRARVVPCGADLCATNTFVRDPQSQEKVGDVLRMQLQAAGSGIWTGTARDERRQQTFDMRLSIAGDHMTTRGCTLAGLLCRSAAWTKAGD